MREAVKKKIYTVNEALKAGIPPEKNEDKCTYCRYKHECKLVDTGTWEHPNPPVKKKASGKKSQKKPQSKAIRKVCANCSNYYRGTTCKCDGKYADGRRKCRFTPSKFVEDGTAL